jgi:hypothetical protein
MPRGWTTRRRIISTLGELADEKAFDCYTLGKLLDQDFDSALTIFRLFLDLSKDRLETGQGLDSMAQFR